MNKIISLPTQAKQLSPHVWVVILPWFLFTARDKVWRINLNEYRNTYYQTLNKVKQGFNDLLAPQVLSLPKFQAVRITYRIYPSSKRRLDIGNIGSIADKFFSDCLVVHERLVDDNHKYVQEVKFAFGGYRDIACIEAEIKEII